MCTKVDVFVDYVCPFCFLVESAIEELKRDRDVEVRIRPFELLPDPVPTLRPEDEYLPRVWDASVYPMADRVGVPMSLPSISPRPRTETASQCYSWPRKRAKPRHIPKQCSKPSSRTTVTSVRTRSSPMSPLLLVSAGVEAARADQDYAVNTVGINSVPGILIDGQLLSGVPGAARLNKPVDSLAGHEGIRKGES